MAAVRAFREPYLVAELLDDSAFGDFGARKTRYAIYWAFYESTAYRNLHKWAKQYRVKYGLYDFIRNIYNPAYRLGEFWKAHLLGGRLDPMAGDGSSGATAIPIATPKEMAKGGEALRVAVAQIWLWSKWAAKKDLYTLYGSVLGDVFLEIVDDPERKKVYLETVHPGKIESVEVDAQGHVKGYVLSYKREDPEKTSGRMVTYREEVTRDGDSVVYQTYRDKSPYAWDENGEEWTNEYGFVPMIFVQHNDVGLEWGWAEIHAARSKIHELDDIASKLSDYIRKTIDPIWFITGAKKGASEPKVEKETPTSDRPEPGREKVPVIYAPKDAKADAMIAPLDIEQSLSHIKMIMEEVERDYPELQMDIWTVSGERSGRALRLARQRAETKVTQRRAAYDDAMVRANQMAVAIAGMRGYEGFDGFSLDSYLSGDLNHHIGKRPVFAVDPQDDAEIERAFWLAAKAAKEAGMPLLIWLDRQGWSEEDIAQVAESEEYQSRIEAMQMARAAFGEATGRTEEGEKEEGEGAE